MFKDISNFLCFERLQRPIGRYLIGHTGSARSSERRFDVLFASASEATATWRFTNFVLYCIV